MKKHFLLVLFMLSATANASLLDINSAMLGIGGEETSSDAFSQAFSVQTHTGGDVLVIGTFSTRAESKVGMGYWQLKAGTATSTEISRTLDKKTTLELPPSCMSSRAYRRTTRSVCSTEQPMETSCIR